MPSAPGILDPSAMERLRRIGGDRLVGKMLTTFDAFATEKVAQMQNACAAQRWTDAGDAAHALKSSAGNVGAVNLQRLSFEVERAGREEDADRVPSLVEELVAAFGEAQAALAELEPQGESP